MKEKLVTLGSALGALALFLAMFLHGDDEGNGRGDVRRPTSEEQSPNGYHAAMVWLANAGIRTVSVRERFNKLSAQPPVAQGNLLVVTLPVVTTFKTEELRSLESWVRAGNTLLVLAALSDAPNWAFVLGRSGPGDLGLLTGLEFEAVKSRGHRTTPRQRHTLVPNGPYAYFEGVRSAVALSDYPAQAWTVKIPYDGFALSLAREQETGDEVLWTRPLGNGRIIVSGLGSLFTNRALGLADNGRLLANVVGAALGPGGAVLFDDMHQGLAAAYDPAKFYSDPRLYETVAILAALWLCWVLGSTKLRLSVTRTPVPREADLVRVTGGFLARVVTTDTGARGLFEHFFRRIGGHLPSNRATGSPPWEVLEGHPGIAAADLRQLKDWYADASAARRVPLRRLHNLILRIEGHFIA